MTILSTPVDIILGIPHVGRTADTEEFAQNTRDNLQIAFELARRNLTERADKQAEQNSKLKPYPVFKPGQEVLDSIYTTLSSTLTLLEYFLCL